MQQPTAAPPDSAKKGDPSAFFLDAGRLLPAVCPACGAPGHHPAEVPPIDGFPASDVEALYCDLCAESEQASTTRRVGLIAAASLFIFSAVTALTLALGGRFLTLQVAVSLGLALLIAEGFARTPLWPRAPVLLALGKSSPDQRAVLVTWHRKFRRALEDDGWSSAPLPDRLSVRASARPGLLLRASLGGLALLSLGLIHSLGTASVRVLVGGSERAYLLVDARRSSPLDPTNAEDPTAGQFVRVLGGRRSFELVTTDGEILLSETKTIWPGRTYIVGHLPPERCLFWERRRYAAEGDASLLLPVGGSGPIWELSDRVDSWFLPLTSPGEEQTPGAALGTSGGTRRAIRLLPCRAPER